MGPSERCERWLADATEAGRGLIVGLSALVPLASPAKPERFWYEFRNCGFRVLGEWSHAARPNHSTPNESRRSACSWRTGGSHV
jgi:hypothetical protein